MLDGRACIVSPYCDANRASWCQTVLTTHLSRQTCVNRVLTLNPNRKPVKSQKPAWKSQGISPADFGKLQNNNNKNTYRNQGYQLPKEVPEWAGR